MLWTFGPDPSLEECTALLGFYTEILLYVVSIRFLFSTLGFSVRKFDRSEHRFHSRRDLNGRSEYQEARLSVLCFLPFSLLRQGGDPLRCSKSSTFAPFESDEMEQTVGFTSSRSTSSQAHWIQHNKGTQTSFGSGHIFGKE